MGIAALQSVLALALFAAFTIWIHKRYRKRETKERDLSLFDFDDTLERPGVSDTYL